MDYVNLFKEFSIPIDISRLKAGWVNVPCPFCGGTSLHMGFNTKDDFCSCFKCGGHNLRMALSKLLNIPNSALSKILEPFQARGAILSRLNREQKPNKEKIALPGYPLSLREKNYLLERRFNPYELVEKYNIQGGGWLPDWRNRIIIPVYISGKLITWTARTVLEDREPRYKNLDNVESVIDPKKVFFNLDNCYLDKVALLEGPFDVLRFGDNGICGFGITLTKTQVLYLSERLKQVYILFDSQRSAQKTAKEIGMTLQGHGLDVYIADVFGDFGCKDAAEMSPYKIKKLKQELGFFPSENPSFDFIKGKNWN